MQKVCRYSRLGRDGKMCQKFRTVMFSPSFVVRKVCCVKSFDIFCMVCVIGGELKLLETPGAKKYRASTSS